MHLQNYYIKVIEHISFFGLQADITRTWDVGGTLEELINHSPAAGDLRIRLCFTNILLQHLLLK